MNTIKSILMVLVLFFSVFAGSANAVTVSIVPNKSLGLDYAGYPAGIGVANIDGEEYWVMLTNYNYAASNPEWFLDSTPQEATLLTQDDILAGANTLFPAESYSKAAPLFLDGLLGYSTIDMLWVSSYNEMVWDVMSSPGVWQYSNTEYPNPGSGITLYDVYSTQKSGLDPNYDYRGIMKILKYNSLEIELLVFGPIPATTPTIPIPPTVWLFFSGLIGLVSIARRR